MIYFPCDEPFFYEKPGPFRSATGALLHYIQRVSRRDRHHVAHYVAARDGGGSWQPMGHSSSGAHIGRDL